MEQKRFCRSLLLRFDASAGKTKQKKKGKKTFFFGGHLFYLGSQTNQTSYLSDLKGLTQEFIINQKKGRVRHDELRGVNREDMLKQGKIYKKINKKQSREEKILWVLF